jgi:protease-4
MGRITGFLTGLFLTLLIVQMLPSFIRKFKSEYEGIFDLKVKIGLLTIKDQIKDCGYYMKELKKLFEKDDIKAILIHIESPGGAAGSSQALYNEILNYKKEYPKPVVALTNDVCASGGYYIACAADYIISSPSALVGSIGAYLGTFKIKELLDSWKIKYSIRQSGKYKTVLNPFTPTNAELDEIIQSTTDDVYKQFMTDVAARRKLSISQADKWANGKFFTGKQAFELGLVDELGSESNAEKKIRELAMIEKEKKIDWIKPSKLSKYEQLFGLDDENVDSFLDKAIEKLCIKLGISENPKIMLN